MSPPDTPITFTQKHEDILLENARGIKENARGIKENARGIKENARGIKENAQGIKENAQGIKNNSRGIKKNGIEIHRQGIMMEDLQSTLQKVLEVVTHTNERFQQQDDHELKLQHHENRISAIESHIKAN